jgi:alkanesulfonate monooxygenase SsuD/methylene tetrahydromethanopterin reductase-like flavin-dependent oxidoreductase (luciferase family)
MTDQQHSSGTAAPQADAAARPRRPLKVGLNLPTVEGTLAGKTATWADLLAFAQRAEALGFDSLWVPDHLLLRWAERTRGIWEGWSLLAALGAVTERVELGPLVTRTSLRHPALLAKMASTVDEISGGRLVLGLGAGGGGPEDTTFGFPDDHRVDRFSEALQIIRTLLRTGHVDFAGQYYQVRDYALQLRGPRPGGPPILIGAKGPRMLRVAATYADLWNAEGPLRRPEEIIPLRAAADAACAEVGRDPSTLGRSASVVVNLPLAQGGGGQGAPAQGARQEPTSPEEIADLLRGYARGGLSHIQLWLTPSTIAGLEWFAAVLDLLDHG